MPLENMNKIIGCLGADTEEDEPMEKRMEKPEKCMEDKLDCLLKGMEVRGAAEPSAVKKEDEPFQVLRCILFLCSNSPCTEFTCIPVACICLSHAHRLAVMHTFFTSLPQIPTLGFFRQSPFSSQRRNSVHYSSFLQRRVINPGWIERGWRDFSVSYYYAICVFKYQFQASLCAQV